MANTNPKFFIFDEASTIPPAGQKDVYLFSDDLDERTWRWRWQTHGHAVLVKEPEDVAGFQSNGPIIAHIMNDPDTYPSWCGEIVSTWADRIRLHARKPGQLEYI